MYINADKNCWRINNNNLQYAQIIFFVKIWPTYKTIYFPILSQNINAMRRNLGTLVDIKDGRDISFNIRYGSLIHMCTCVCVYPRISRHDSMRRYQGIRWPSEISVTVVCEECARKCAVERIQKAEHVENDTERL